MKKKYKSHKRVKAFNTRRTNKSHKRTKKSDIGGSYIKLTQDLMFKIYFTKNKKVLLSLLKAFLPLPAGKIIERVDILNPHTLPEAKEKKQIVLDLKLRLNDKEKINVEMQSTQKKDFLSRVLFYWAKLYTEDLKASEAYQKTPTTYSLIFTDFQVFKETTDVVTCFSLLSDNPPHFCFNHDLKIVFVELKKFKKKIGDLIDKREDWCYTLKHSSEIKPGELAILSKRNEDMKEAVVHLKRLSKDEKLKLEEEARIKFIRDQMAEKAWAREEGLKEGREEGREQGREEGWKQGVEEGIQKNLQKIVYRMLKEGFNISAIKKATGLSQTKIQKLKKKNNTRK